MRRRRGSWVDGRIRWHCLTALLQAQERAPRPCNSRLGNSSAGGRLCDYVLRRWPSSLEALTRKCHIVMCCGEASSCESMCKQASGVAAHGGHSLECCWMRGPALAVAADPAGLVLRPRVNAWPCGCGRQMVWWN